MALNEVLDILMFVTALALLMAGFPVAFTLAGTGLIFGSIGYALGVFDFGFLGAITQRIYGTMTNEILIAVPLFVFMGVMLLRSRVAEELLDSMGRMFGELRGGLGISVSVVGALMAASTGIVGATVVTMGVLALPTMLRRGYDPALACGSICAAGTLGQIIPPSIVLVLLGDVISSAYQQAQLEQGLFSPEAVSVGDLFAGALLPGLGLVSMYILYQIAMAWFRPESSPPVPPDDTLDAGAAARWSGIAHALVPPTVLIVSVLGSILAGVATPTEAAAVGAVGALLLAGYRLEKTRRRSMHIAGVSLIALLVLADVADLRLASETIPTSDMIAIALAFLFTVGLAWGTVISLIRVWRERILHEVVRGTTEITSMVFVILIGAAVFSLVFRGLGGDDMVRRFLTDMPGGVLGAMLVVMLIMFVLGFFLDFIEITFVVVPIVAPVLLQMDLNPIWLGVMMAVNLQTSFLTPPFGFALFYLRGVAPETVTTGQIYRGVAPFVVIQLFALALLAQFPAIATWLPKVIFGSFR